MNEYAQPTLQVGRREDPLSDAQAVLAIRQAVGPGVVLRADCNRGWTLEQAVEVRLRAGSGAGGGLSKQAKRKRRMGG